MTTNSTEEVTVLLSGGIDSAACLHYFVRRGRPTLSLHVDYGQLARIDESSAARAIATHYRVRLIEISWNAWLERTDGYIRGRNLFLIAAALLEMPKSVTTLAIGIHAGTGYSDCSESFVHAAQQLIRLYSPPLVHLASPFIRWGKADVFAYARTEGVPLYLTYSCERSEGPCGRCISCRDRKALHVAASAPLDTSSR